MLDWLQFLCGISLLFIGGMLFGAAVWTVMTDLTSLDVVQALLIGTLLVATAGGAAALGLGLLLAMVSAI
jgi:hypothetical protein